MRGNRPRNYKNVATVDFGRNQHLRARSKVALLKGQRFGRAGKARKLSPAETAVVTERLRLEGIL
jgi:hypothetical protein